MGYSFKSSALLTEALTHSSYAYKHGLPSNERLEFLGDRILSMVIANQLFRSCPSFKVGQLHTIQCALENNKSLAYIARQIHIKEHLRFIETPTCPEPSENMLADFMEAIIGAIFLDGGVDEAQAFISRHFNFKKVGPSLLEPERIEGL